MAKALIGTARAAVRPGEVQWGAVIKLNNSVNWLQIVLSFVYYYFSRILSFHLPGIHTPITDFTFKPTRRNLKQSDADFHARLKILQDAHRQSTGRSTPAHPPPSSAFIRVVVKTFLLSTLARPAVSMAMASRIVPCASCEGLYFNSEHTTSTSLYHDSHKYP